MSGYSKKKKLSNKLTLNITEVSGQRGIRRLTPNITENVIID